MTATVGGSRLLPLEFTSIDGAWWAILPVEMAEGLLPYDGLPADVILLEGDTARVRGILVCGTMRSERRCLVKVLPDEDSRDHAPRRDLPRAA